MKKVHIVSADITQIPSDAIITTTTNSTWFGGIDNAIHGVAGYHFHNQITKAHSLKDGDIVIAKGDDIKHDGEFKNVIFIIDKLKKSLGDVIFNGLVAASNAGFKTVTLPTIRMGLMTGLMEDNKNEAVHEIANGVSRFLVENPDTTIESITFVVFVDPDTMRILEKAFERE